VQSIDLARLGDNLAPSMASARRNSSIYNLALSGGWVAAARVFDLAASYVFYILLAHAAGVHEFGRLLLAITVAETTSVVTRLGLDTASMRKAARARAAGEGGLGAIVARASLVA